MIAGVPRSSPPVYESNPDSMPDSAFRAGEIRFLVAGNGARLLDPRRTPVRISGVFPDEGTFEVEILAFEDRGARWRVPFEEVGRYQFEVGVRTAPETLASAYAAIAERFDRTLEIDVDPRAHAASLERIATERAAAAAWLEREGLGEVEIGSLARRREGDPALAGLLERYLAGRDLLVIDSAFCEAFVSNPAAGELVKGHAIVLAELGLCPYAGKVTRSEHVFSGVWERERRASHLLTRVGFTQALWQHATPADVALYRGMSAERALAPGRSSSFVSATFSFEVALEHFRGGPATRVAAFLRQSTPPERLLATFLETPALSVRFKEAEAILLGDPGNALF